MSSASIPKGYKQTEVGVIPEEWLCKPLAKFSAFITKGSTPTTYGFKWEHSGVPFLRSECVSDNGLDMSQSMFISENAHAMLNRSEVCNGDLLVTITGNVGRVIILNGVGRANINQHIARVRISDQDISPSYVFHYLDQPLYRKYFNSITTGQAYPQLSLKQIRDAEIPLPPLPEQRAIAQVLSDTDALIGSLDKLIAKKKGIKQGAMQELLTGRRRVGATNSKGYKQTEVGVIPEEWEVKTLSELFRFSGGFTASRDQLSSKGICYLHYGDIHLSRKTFINIVQEFLEIPKLDISLSNVSRSSLLDDGDVVFVDASEDDDGASKHIVVVNPSCLPYISGLHTIVAKQLRGEFEKTYLRYCFQTEAIKKQFKYYAVGTKVSGISKTNIAKIFMSLPPIAEQRAIAQVLSDMDAEIAELEERREKTKAMKQGLMQVLLTGKVRLA